WDLYMTQWHGIDNTQHAFLRFDKSVLTEKEAQVCDNVVLKTYEIADELVGDILQATKNAQDPETYTIALSDHGHVMGKRRFFINAYLYQKGFIKLKRDNDTNKVTVDWENTLAFSQGMVHIYVNLKGRDPHGCVNPGKDHDEVVQQVIDALYDAKDPKTGMRPIILALSNKDAEFIGLSGERVGDVIFAANPVYAGDNRLKVSGDMFEDLKVGFRDASIHGAQLPALDMGDFGTIKAMFIASGPKIKKGHVLKKPINMVDIAPTISHILNIPGPKDCEGKILHDIFE
ncbi:MAG TPA: alkaline phosphatase family protein, partial [Candidatus Bathyarchaeia archaeon]|nr:alkaline phosphatase family protein [Candidatus Bathyarchaeia archaeon]